MSLRRFHVRPDAVVGDRLAFQADEARHMARALRLVPGDVVAAIDGHGSEYVVRLDSLTPAGAVGTVLERAERASDSPLSVTLAQAIPKGDKMDAIIRAGAELGVAQVVPLVTERTVVRLTSGAAAARRVRWQRIAHEAAKQCGRAMVPDVDGVQRLGDFVTRPARGELRLCLWEGATEPMVPTLESHPGPTAVALIIGPEGGLAPAEVELATARGYISVSLGRRILRVETAGPAVISILQSRFGDLGR